MLNEENENNSVTSQADSVALTDAQPITSSEHTSIDPLASIGADPKLTSSPQPQVILPQQQTAVQGNEQQTLTQTTPNAPVAAYRPLPVVPHQAPALHLEQQPQHMKTANEQPAQQLRSFDTDQPAHTTKFNKIFIAMSLLVVLTGVGYGLFRVISSSVSEETDISRAYDATSIVELKADRSYSSPIGFLPPFQEADISGGDYSLTNFNVIPANMHLSNLFVVSDSDEVKFKAISNIDKVNGFLDYLYSKGGDPESEEDKNALAARAKHASQYATLDFTTLLGLGSFYDTSNVFGGYFVYTQASLDGEESDVNTLTLKTDTCRQSYEKAKIATSTKTINTKTLNPTYRLDGERYVVDVDMSVVEESFKSVYTYFDDCFDFSKPSLVEYEDYIEKLKKSPKQLPEISFTQVGDAWELRMSNPSFEQSFSTFMIDNLQTSQTRDSSVQATDFYDLNTQFGIVHDLCRVPPTRLSEFGGSKYTFIAEVSSYYAPNNFDSSYVCVPSQAIGYRANSFGIFIYLPQGGTIDIGELGLLQFQVAYELRFVAEQYYVENSFYPEFEYLRAEVEKIDGLKVVMDDLIAKEHLVYKLLPEGCIKDTCNDFVLTRIIRDEPLDITINLDAYSYDHKSEE